VIPENKEIITEKRWYSLILDDIFLLAAAGRISRALMIKIPIHLIENITIIAITTLKQSSIRFVLIFLLRAREVLIPDAWISLKQRNQKSSVAIKITIKNIISFKPILKISPTSNPVYFEKLPPLDKMTRPMDILREEKTEMTVSVETVFLRFILFKSNANTTANTSIAMFVSAIPNNVPIATPVMAECPKASEKNAILLFTIIVPRIPNKGVTIRIARRAFFIKLYCTQENGRTVSIISYSVCIFLLLSYPKTFLNSSLARTSSGSPSLIIVLSSKIT
jgi:hypothetical protein